MIDLVSGRTPLRKAGVEWRGRCPFHDERTPSFWVDPLKKVYFCFGCQASGDAIGFIRETESPRLHRRDRMAGRPLRRRAAVRGVEPGAGPAAPRARPAVRAAERRRRVLLALPVGRRRRPRRPGPTWPTGGSPTRRRRRFAWATRRPRPTGSLGPRDRAGIHAGGAERGGAERPRGRPLSRADDLPAGRRAGPQSEASARARCRAAARPST